jgi:hypothetical protein
VGGPKKLYQLLECVPDGKVVDHCGAY